MAKLLIHTLNSGEAALPVLVRQLARQSFQDFEHEVVSGLPNREAQTLQYRTFMQRAASYDLFMKLDADMTFRSDTSLADAVRAIDDHPAVEHFVFRLWDCFTEAETEGVHIYRSGVTWGDFRDDLFVDSDPVNTRQILWDGPPAPFINHGEVVSDFECFSFGVHKFLKVAQRGRRSGGLAHKSHKFARHMQNCARIRDLYRATHARRHQFALTGVIWAMHHDDMRALSSKTDLEQVFEAEVRGQEAKWCRRVDRLSQSLLVWRLALVRTLGPRRGFADLSPLSVA
jgi:hypothetical protein